ncbi:MAG: hypothetical protein R3A52_25745 [Polyangiales bacterium]
MSAVSRGASTAEQQGRALLDGVAFAERFFMGESEVQKALVKVCAALDADGIPYALAGAMALNAHGYRRVTTDVDLLLTREGLEAFKSRHLGRGWVERFPGSKGMRDTEHNVKIDVLIAGDYPGDGLPKPVAFPDPSVARRVGGVAVLPVERLVELKLASGLSNPDRMKDLADVQELIRFAGLPETLAASLDPSVRAEYARIWSVTRKTDEDD